MSVILANAQHIANRIVQILGPHCDLIHIAGSIRRKQAQVKDIEIVCLPKRDSQNEDLFGAGEEVLSPGFVNALAGITRLVVKGRPQGRYMEIVLQNCSLVLDLFLPTKNDYCRQLAIRTGSADFSQKVLAHGWRRHGWVGCGELGLRKETDCINKDDKWKCVKLDGELPPVWKSEEEFFDWIGVNWIPPELRDLKTTIDQKQLTTVFNSHKPATGESGRSIMDKFDIDYQFDFYLQKVKLRKEDMSPTQLVETKQAFIAGISSMLVMNTEIGLMQFEKSKPIIEKLWGQCMSFWNEKLQDMQGRQN